MTKSSGSGATSTLVNNGWAIESGGVGGSLLSAGATSGAGRMRVPVSAGHLSAAVAGLGVAVVLALVGCLV
ncbi:hypothetical protein SAICODRAFT_30700 [Saitoella complicata NRRL Y-17804]|nr:uncharacterized protein SAICODRAFT_30700 [Saitoella complicata NRRL Y-17804]ODQ52596.1 hypothetical protein SAICODRAFT_30700 [Saitoella complicata NRRL Y-17804]